MAVLNYTSTLIDRDEAGTLPAYDATVLHRLITFDEAQTKLQKQIDGLLGEIKQRGVNSVMRHIFTDLTRLLEILRIVEMNVRADGPLAVTVSILTLVHHETRSLVDFIEAQAAQTKCIKGKLHQELTCTSFAIKHELRRVFTYEFAELRAGHAAHHVRADVLRVHGLLSNCFQQSVLALTRVFDASMNGSRLFDDYKTRFEQSVVLHRELSALVRLAQRAEVAGDAATNNLLIEHLKAFCHGTMHHLNYKDWDGFERYAQEVIAKRNSASYTTVLHCFVRYLETLISYVQMRTVLNEPAAGHPAAPAPAQKSGGRPRPVSSRRAPLDRKTARTVKR